MLVVAKDGGSIMGEPKIKEIKARIICPICKGKGCYDCGNKGYFEEWIDFEKFISVVKTALDTIFD